ncbi:MAG: LysM peptidoglycan-binding domain-containing protein [Methylacidiphilales bacterium]|nr:LysM peptidoglycan-binding domain-containing protein [Candidatus Methylacidiphilales bacterium]
MENNESNLKPQSTGGLKLMTVFIVVLVLHVLVIGGVTIYHLMGGGDADLADNKAPKDAKVAADGSVVMDSQLPDGGQPDKTAAAESTTPAPAIEQTAPAETAPSPAPATAAAAPDASTPTGPVVTPPQPPAPEPTASAEPTVAMEPTTAPPIEPETPVAPVISGTYVVKMHDTLAKIAHRHHTTVAKLETANDLNGELLHVGERLVIPGKTEVVAVPATYTTGTTILSGTPATPPDETPAAPAPSPASASHHTYTVVKGDTLSRIAHKFRTTAKALMEANNITDPTKLSIGKKLRIPSREAQTTTAATPVQATTTAAPAPAPAPAPPQNAVQPDQPKTTGQLANFVQ